MSVEKGGEAHKTLFFAFDANGSQFWGKTKTELKTKSREAEMTQNSGFAIVQLEGREAKKPFFLGGAKE